MAMLDKYTRFIPHLAGNYPSLFYPLLGLCKGLPNRRAQCDTELTLEGYPRSGNTFAVRAFKYAQQRSVRLAHHLHVPAQVIQSARLGIPACVIIREPEATVRSLVLKYPYIPVSVALRGYALFYETCWRYREHFIVADFEQVVSDFGMVIDDINVRFGTHFARFQHTRPNVERIFENLDRKAMRADGGKVLGGFYPYPAREQAKRVVNLAASTRLLRRCRTIYGQFQALVRQSERRIDIAERPGPVGRGESEGLTAAMKQGTAAAP
jgi:hypothetical protein